MTAHLQAATTRREILTTANPATARAAAPVMCTRQVTVGYPSCHLPSGSARLEAQAKIHRAEPARAATLGEAEEEKLVAQHL
jgi:hypothetical protein